MMWWYNVCLWCASRVADAPNEWLLSREKVAAYFHRLRSNSRGGDSIFVAEVVVGTHKVLLLLIEWIKMKNSYLNVYWRRVKFTFRFYFNICSNDDINCFHFCRLIWKVMQKRNDWVRVTLTREKLQKQSCRWWNFSSVHDVNDNENRYCRAVYKICSLFFIWLLGSNHFTRIH